MAEQEAQLIAAVQSGDLAVVKALLAADPALVNTRTPDELPVVLLALYYGQNEIARHIDAVGAAAGAELDLFAAAALGKVTRVAHILNQQPELVNSFATDGFTALGLAAFFGHQTVAQALIARGADVRLASNNPLRVQPLHSAAASRHMALVELLLAAGADVNARQEGGFTPLHSAAQNGHLEMMRLLLERHADPRARTDDGKSPQDVAAEAGQQNAVEVLRQVS